MITLFGKKKKKEEEEKSLKKKPEKKPKVSKEPPKKITKIPTRKSKIAWESLHSPLISEKSSFLEENGKYVFKVLKESNKSEIKKSIEDLYNIKVDKVNIINIKRKFRRLGRTEGWKPGYKKAIITPKKGEKIEISSR